MDGKSTKKPFNEGFLASVAKYFGKYIIRDAPADGTNLKGGIRRIHKTEDTEKKTARPRYLEFLNDSAEKISYVLRGIGIFCITWLIGCAAMVSGVRPLGLAFASASGAYAPWAYAGLAASSIVAGESALPVLASCFLSLMLRITICKYLSFTDNKVSLFSENLILRAVVSFVSAAFAASLTVMLRGFYISDLLFAIVGVIVTPAAVFLYSGVIVKEKRFTLHYEAAVASLIFSAILAMRDFSILGVSLDTFCAMAATLYISKHGGILRGGVIGLICGLASSAIYAPAFALAGLCSGFLWSKSSIVALLASCFTCTMYGIYAEGLSALASFVPDVLAATAAMTPIIYFNVVLKLRIFSMPENFPDEVLAESILSLQRERASTEKIQAISDSMKSLSEVFYSLSDRIRKPGIFDIRRMCDKVWLEKCNLCGLNTVCWDRDYSTTSDALNKLSRAIAEKGVVSTSDLSGPLLSRCPHNEKLISELNSAHARILEESAKRDHTEVFALDYEAVARLLEEAGAANAAEFEVDEKRTALARTAAKRSGLFSGNVTVYGKRKLSLVAGSVDMSKLNMSSDEIRGYFGKACGTSFCPPRFDIDSDFVTMTLTRERKISVETAYSSLRKDGEAQNGDSIVSVFNREDYFYQIISDGMGSGRDAALTSRVTCIFLQKLLEAGNRKNIAVEMLNNFIRKRNMECFATVDMMEIDLLNASASFIKSGAAPSYILRDGKLFRITSNSLPIGITRVMNAEEVKFDLQVGDIIVMMSDGVSQTLEDGIWLADLLTFGWSDGTDLDGMVKKILEGAERNNRRGDDMTVGLIKIKEYQGENA